MKALRLLTPLLVLPLVAFAASERALKIDRSRSFVEVDVDATKNFTAHLDRYDLVVRLDDAGKVKGGTFSFKFTDLKTGDTARDADMIKWLGGGEPEGRFELGNLAVTPTGQGQASGRLTFHGATERVEFPVEITKAADGIVSISGEATLDYREWGLKVIRKVLVLSVNPEVKVRFKLTGTPVEVPVPAAK